MLHEPAKIPHLRCLLPGNGAELRKKGSGNTFWAVVPLVRSNKSNPQEIVQSISPQTYQVSGFDPALVV